jgi:hypothetical protein
MKKWILIIILLTASNIIKAQDTLLLRSGVNILVKVTEVGTSEIKYKKVDNLNGPTFVALKSDLLSINYENGTKDDYSKVPKLDGNIDLFTKGQNDAIINYQGYKTAGTGTLITTAFPIYGTFLGIAPTVLCSSAEPKDENLGYPDINLMKNEQYAAGYKQKAKQIKNNKILKNYFSGLAIQGGFFLALVIALASSSH